MLQIKTSFQRFTLLSLLILLSSASFVSFASKTIFSATCTVDNRVDIAGATTNQEINASQASISGGKLYVNNQHSSTGGMMRPSIGPSGTKKSAFYMYGTKHSFRVELTSPQVLAVGDVISAKLYIEKGTYPEANNGLWFSTSSTRPASAPTTKATTTSTGIWQDISYTVTAGDGLVGQSGFYIYYALRTDDSRTAFTDFAITRSTWKFKCENDGWTEHPMNESAGVASYSINLPADSRIEFCFDDNGTVYKNQGAIITTTSGWTFNTSDNNCRIHTGPAGTYTFTINTTSKVVTVTYPTVIHPNPHYVYFKNTNVWGTVYGYLENTGNDNKAAAWPGSVMQPTTEICGETYHYAALNALNGTYNNIIFNNGYTGYGNQTSNLSTSSSLGKYNANQDATWHDFPCMVEIPGTVDNDPAPTLGNGATWYNTNYIDLNHNKAEHPTDYAEWNVYLPYPGTYAVSETGFYKNGHQYRLELRSGGTIVASYETEEIWTKDNTKDLTFDLAATWDLSDVEAGGYTLRVQDMLADGWSEPKLKSITLSFCVSKVPNKKLYGDIGDKHRAYGTITNAILATWDHIPSGAISVSDSTLTIGSESITAPAITNGRLDSIPTGSCNSCYTDASCVWRFKEWNTTELKAVYFPTFAVDYNTNGGTINDPEPYTHWYEYTGLSSDITELPMDVTKDGYLFAGWYQDESTKELFPYLTGNYYGDYAGEWCLRAHWVLPCDEQKVITAVTLTGTSTYTRDGYDAEYIGTPEITITGSGTAVADVYDDVAGDETGYQLGSGDMVMATLGTGTFRVGDVVSVYITAKNYQIISTSSNLLELYYKTSGGTYVRLTRIRDASTPGKYSYTLASDDVIEMDEAGAVSIGIYSKPGTEQDPCVYRVEVVGCRDLYFDDNAGTHVWDDPENWAPTYHEIPSYYQAAHILKPCTVNIANAQAKYIELEKDAVKGHDGKLTINADAALAVEETVKEARGESLYAVQASNLVILANSDNQGAFAHGDALGTTQATVQFYARGNGTGPRGETLAYATWQYMGVPFSDVTNAQSHYYDGWMCQWIENTVGNAGSNWKWINNGDALTPFAGYCLTQNAQKTYTNTGTLVPSTNQTLTVTYTTGEGYGYFGWNMFANSWMAPINIAKFTDGDFSSDKIDKTIYLFNTGISDGKTAAASGSGTGSEGNYVSVPFKSAGSMLDENLYIAPMQGFYLLATDEGTHTVTLNYDRLVRNAEHGNISVGPNRAKKDAEDNKPAMSRIIIDVKGEYFSDRLYIFENAEQTNGFDNGWDGWKFEGETYAPQLMTRTNDLDLAVDVSPAFDGKRIAFRVGEDSEYTLHFSSTEAGLYLRDLTTNDTVAIASGNSYSFMAFNSVSEERFEIIDRRNEIPSGWDEIKNDASFDILDMTVYTADGRLVLHRTNDFNKTLALPQNGTYIVYLTTTAGKHVHKIVF